MSRAYGKVWLSISVRFKPMFRVRFRVSVGVRVKVQC
jgi:hypothetical protein